MKISYQYLIFELNWQDGLAWSSEPSFLARSSESPGQGPGDLSGGQEQHCQHHPEQRAGGGDSLRPGQDQDSGPEEEHGAPRLHPGDRGNQTRSVADHFTFIYLSLII